jgi:N-acetylglutamate synthase-like GNAT family acetyltransferase
MARDPEFAARAATLRDRDALTAFLTRAATDDNIDRFDVLGHLQEFVLPVAQVEAGQLFVVARAWSIVALASVVFRHDGDIEIDALLIDPSADRDEAGRLLAGECRAFARRVGAAAVYVTVLESTAPAFKRWGFETLGADDTMQGPAALKMRMPV